MRYTLLTVTLVLIGTVAVVAQYQHAQRFTATTPRVMQYPGSCFMVDPDQDSPSCRNDGVDACKRANVGNEEFCFRNCAQHVLNVCDDPVWVPRSVPPHFEKSFDDELGCRNAVIAYCADNALSTFDSCRRDGYAKCSSIGRIVV